ncbi:hypothetical protein GCM10009621_09980 [Corynebacterium felinum]|nr:NPCBM/NEW2 domain-containing protein [Corynebacterium felinum]
MMHGFDFRRLPEMLGTILAIITAVAGILTTFSKFSDQNPGLSQSSNSISSRVGSAGNGGNWGNQPGGHNGGGGNNGVDYDGHIGDNRYAFTHFVDKGDGKVSGRRTVWVNGQRYDNSLYLNHANNDYGRSSAITSQIRGQFQRFTTTLAVPDNSTENQRVNVLFYADDRKVGEYNVVPGHPQAIEIPLNGVRRLNVVTHVYHYQGNRKYEDFKPDHKLGVAIVNPILHK